MEGGEDTMAHTISKQIYSDIKKKYIECEVLILDEEEGLPDTDRREIVLYCSEGETPFSEISDDSTSDVADLYEETELIDQYADFDNKDSTPGNKYFF